jgi:hypothetical protein
MGRFRRCQAGIFRSILADQRVHASLPFPTPKQPNKDAFMKFLSLVLSIGALLAFGACQTVPPYARDTKLRTAKELKVEPKAHVTFKTPDAVLNQGPHTLALMNFSTAWTCIAVSVDKTHWLNIAKPIGRTCARPITEMDNCFNEGKYLPIGKVNCSQPIQVWLKFRNTQGDIGTLLSPYHLIPNCQEQGTAILFGD